MHATYQYKTLPSNAMMIMYAHQQHGRSIVRSTELFMRQQKSIFPIINNNSCKHKLQLTLYLNITVLCH
jgi:hypothetical protein